MASAVLITGEERFFLVLSYPLDSRKGFQASSSHPDKPPCPQLMTSSQTSLSQFRDLGSTTKQTLSFNGGNGTAQVQRCELCSSPAYFSPMYMYIYIYFFEKQINKKKDCNLFPNFRLLPLTRTCLVPDCTHTRHQLLLLGLDCF